MIKFITKRILHSIPTFLIVTIISYGIMTLAPGDAVTYLMGEEYNPPKAAMLRHEFGLDKSIPERYMIWLGNMVKGNLGTSTFYNGIPVLKVIKNTLPFTLILTGSSLLLAFFLSLVVAIVCTIKNNTAIDRLLSTFGLIGQGIPDFWIANMIIILNCRNIGLFPYIGMGARPDNMSLNEKIMALPIPIAIITIIFLSRNVKYIKAAMQEVLVQEYIIVARSKGIKERSVVLKHALRNALIPIITSLNLSLASLLSTSVIIETIFNCPGIGRIFVKANYARDYPILMALMLTTAVIILIGSLLTDIAYTLADPRIKYE